MKKKYCSTRQHIKYAGTHLLVELWDGESFSSLSGIRKILEDSINACKATLLKISLHKFSPYGGISGVAVISESHLSIHTWPEYKYAAMDIFVCGKVDPYKAVKVIKEGFKPKKIQVVEVKRGVM